MKHTEQTIPQASEPQTPADATSIFSVPAFPRAMEAAASLVLWKPYRNQQGRMAVGRYNEEFPPPQLLKEIRERLESVCADWPRSLFDSMTARAAWIEFKYDRAMTDTFRTMSTRASRSVAGDPAREDTTASPGGR